MSKAKGSVAKPAKATNEKPNNALSEKDAIVTRLGLADSKEARVPQELGTKKSKATISLGKGALKSAREKKSLATFERRKKLLSEHLDEIVRMFKAKSPISTIQSKFGMPTKADILYALCRVGLVSGEKRLMMIVSTERKSGLIPASEEVFRESKT